MIDPSTLEGASRPTGRMSRAAVAAERVAWLVTGIALAGVVLRVPGEGWVEALAWLAVCGSGPLVIWLVRHLRSARQARALLPPEILERRFHGSLAVITDTERRSLRSIGAGSLEV